MKTLLLFAGLLSALGAAAQATSAVEANQPSQTGSISALDAKNGFRTYILGTPISNYPQLKRREKDLYESPKEPLLVGDVKLTKLLFTSYKGRLASITLGTVGVDNIERLLGSFTAEYGPSTSANAVLQSWAGTKATLYVTRVGGGDQEICLVILKSNEIAAEQKREESAAAK